MNRTRRDFLANVGRGMLVASVGASLATDLGFTSSAFAAEDADNRLTFGDLEPLVGLMQDTPASQLLPILVKRIQGGTDLRTLIAAGALANARTFGGQDYVGFHSFMALAPAYQMSRELPDAQKPLPVLKVLYRNTDRMQAFGGSKAEVLHDHDHVADSPCTGEALQQATRGTDFNAAEDLFRAAMNGPAGEAYNHLQYSVMDEVDVHRVVLSWRAWSTLDLTGKDHAHTLLRQSVRYCVNHECSMHNKGTDFVKARYDDPNHVRNVLPRVLDQHKLLGKECGTRKMDDAWIDEMARTIANANRPQAAEAVAAAIADGVSPQDINDAIALAANSLLLRDRDSRTHGDSTGVHASDAANAWRHISEVSNHRNRVASLVIAAFHTAGQSHDVDKTPYPLPSHLEQVKYDDAAKLLEQTEAAIRENNQEIACAAVHRYGSLGFDAKPVFDLMLKYAISEDGRLHAEKYYWTVVEEFGLLRPKFKWRELEALARVTASEYGFDRNDKYGFRAPGYEEACKLLGV